MRSAPADSYTFRAPPAPLAVLERKLEFWMVVGPADAYRNRPPPLLSAVVATRLVV